MSSTGGVMGTRIASVRIAARSPVQKLDPRIDARRAHVKVFGPFDNRRAGECFSAEAASVSLVHERDDVACDEQAIPARVAPAGTFHPALGRLATEAAHRLDGHVVCSTHVMPCEWCVNRQPVCAPSPIVPEIL